MWSDFNTPHNSAGTTNTGVTRKLDNPLKGMWNPIPRKLDNPLKGIQNLFPKESGTSGRYG